MANTMHLLNMGVLYHLHSDSVTEMGERRPQMRGGEDHTAALGDAPYPFDGVLGQDWFGLPTRQDALAAIRHGWPEGRMRAQSALAHLEGDVGAAPRSIRRRKVWSDEGDSPDPDRLRMGDYDRAFVATRRRAQISAGRHLRIFCQSAGHCGNVSDEMFWAGAATVRLTDLLEDAGYRVEILYTSYGVNCYANGRNILATTTLKAGSAFVDPDQLASTLCLSGFFRTYGFHTICCPPEVVRRGLGQPAPATPKLLALAGLYESGDILVPLLRSQEQAEAFIRSALAGVECPQPEALPEPSERRPVGESPAREEDQERREARVEAKAALTEAVKRAEHKIIAEGGTWLHRGLLGRSGFHWNKGSRVWYSAITATAERLMENGLEGVTFRRV